MEKKKSVIEMLADGRAEAEFIFLKLKNEIEKSKPTCFGISKDGELVPIENTQMFQDEMKKSFSVKPKGFILDEIGHTESITDKLNSVGNETFEKWKKLQQTDGEI